MGAMVTVGVHEAKSTLSKLLHRVNVGEEVVITRDGKPVAKLIAIDPPPKRFLGRDVGLFDVPDDFNTPLPDDVIAAFEA